MQFASPIPTLLTTLTTCKDEHVSTGERGVDVPEREPGAVRSG